MSVEGVSNMVVCKKAVNQGWGGVMEESRNGG